MKESRTKVVLGLFLASAVVVLALSLYTGVAMSSLSGSLDQSRSERLVAEAASASLIVSAQELNNFTQPGDIQNDSYAQMIHRLTAFAALHNINEIFYLRQLPDGNMQYIISNLSSANLNNLSSSPIEPTSLTLNALSGAISVISFEDYKSTSGSKDHLQAYAPVFDQTGEVVAIAGVGVTGDALKSVDDQIRNLTIILLACVAVVILAACANVLLQIRKENELQERVHQQALMVDISRTLISDKDIETNIYEVLHNTAVFLGAQRAYLLDTISDPQELVLRHFWEDDEFGQKGIEAELGLIIKSASSVFEPTVGIGDSYSVLLCSNTARDDEGAYEQLYDIGILSFAWAPLYVENNLWGILLLDYIDEPHRWTPSERQLINSAASDLAGAIARNRFNEEREQALDHAVQASEAKSEFLSNMSHEMRTPMNAIIGMTTIALGSDDPERKDYCLNHIKNASSNLLNIINDVLDMSSLQSYSLELVPRPFSVRDAIKESSAEFVHKVSEHSQTFIVNVDDAIPDVLIGDKKRLIQVVGNLLSNANKFTADGGSISLDIKHKGVDENGHRIYVSVTDNGIGISPSLQKNLFASFEQVDSGASRKYGGTGLGLAISRRIVQLMDGYIGLDSEPDKGSTFYFTISLPEGSKEDLMSAAQPPSVAKKPVGDGDGSSGAGAGSGAGSGAGDGDGDGAVGAGNSQPVDEFGQSAAGDALVVENDVNDLAADFSKYHILLAEDIEINREVVFALLESTGIKIDVATNGIEALQAISDHVDDYDLVFMDLQMPEMDGLDATRRIRALPLVKARTLPIIAMTANVFQEDVDQCLAAGMNNHIGKPINIREIYKILREYRPER
jgi:signal transduction histidine kinase/CheY-like chemotaxis protein